MIYLSKRITEKYIRNKDNPHIRIHKVFYKEPRYKNLKSWDRELYAICRDKWSLSLKNNYINEKGEIYFYANQEKLGIYIGVSRKTINESFKKLLELGLLEKESIKTAKGTANIYFLCEIPEALNFEDDYEDDYEEPCNPESQPYDHVTKGYKPCNSELHPHNHVTESYTNKTNIIMYLYILNKTYSNKELKEIDKLIQEKEFSEEIKAEIVKFINDRKNRKLKMTIDAIKLFLNKLAKVENDNYKKYYIDEAIEKGWRTIFPKKNGGQKEYESEKPKGNKSVSGLEQLKDRVKGKMS